MKNKNMIETVEALVLIMTLRHPERTSSTATCRDTRPRR
jgi:hypothetical protein